MARGSKGEIIFTILQSLPSSRLALLRLIYVLAGYLYVAGGPASATTVKVDEEAEGSEGWGLRASWGF